MIVTNIVLQNKYGKRNVQDVHYYVINKLQVFLAKKMKKLLGNTHPHAN